MRYRLFSRTDSASLLAVLTGTFGGAAGAAVCDEAAACAGVGEAVGVAALLAAGVPVGCACDCCCCPLSGGAAGGLGKNICITPSTMKTPSKASSIRLSEPGSFCGFLYSANV